MQLPFTIKTRAKWRMISSVHITLYSNATACTCHICKCEMPCSHSLIPTSSHRPVFNCLQYTKTEAGSLGDLITWLTDSGGSAQSLSLTLSSLLLECVTYLHYFSLQVLYLVGVLLVTFDLLTCVHSQGMLHLILMSIDSSGACPQTKFPVAFR